MTARIVPIRNEQQRRRQIVEQSLRDARAWIDAALDGRCSLAEGLCEAEGALRPGVREVIWAEVS